MIIANLTLGSLFDGIGVFPLAAQRNGITPLWASEIEKSPIKITKKQFPQMLHLGDLTKLHGGKIPPVDIVTFGSPCQNLSTIGNREGLAGKKSNLFYHAIRIIEEMRDATNGKYPTLAIWENVMGAFSSNDRILRPSWKPSSRPKFQFLPLTNGPTPEWCEGETLISAGGSLTVNIGACPNVVAESFSSQILETSVPAKYFLTPNECNRILKLATKVDCRPPQTIEYLLLKQGGKYSSTPTKSAACVRTQKQATKTDFSPVSVEQGTLFPPY